MDTSTLSYVYLEEIMPYAELGTAIGTLFLAVATFMTLRENHRTYSIIFKLILSTDYRRLDDETQQEIENFLSWNKYIKNLLHIYRFSRINKILIIFFIIILLIPISIIFSKYLNNEVISTYAMIIASICTISLTLSYIFKGGKV